MYADITVILLIILAAYFDITTSKIPNRITVTLIIFGILYNTITNGITGLIFSSLGIMSGVIVFIIPFILGGMGGGDVKLMAAIGALKGWRFVLITTIYTGIVGGVIVILILIRQKKLLKSLKRVLSIILKPIMFFLTLNFENKKLKQFNSWLLDSQIDWEKQYIPYGVAIGIGAIMAYFM